MGNFRDYFYLAPGSRIALQAPVTEPYIAAVKAAEQHKSMGYIVSFFEDKAKQPYVMIVNKRHGEFMSRKGGRLKTVVALTKDVKKAYSISNKTGKEEEIKLGSNNAFEKVFDGGGAILLRLELKATDPK